jgi:thioredoxin 2
MSNAPDCGQCHQALFDRHPLALDAASFDKHIGRNQIPVLVDFWAPWCGPCRMMAPAYEQAAGLLEPQVRVAKLNTEEAQAIAARFNIRSIPTLALFVGGKEVARQAGAFRTAQDIADWSRSHL